MDQDKIKLLERLLRKLEANDVSSGDEDMALREAIEELTDNPECEFCQTRGTEKDPVAHFKDPKKFGDYIMAHAQCGEDQELELA